MAGIETVPPGPAAPSAGVPDHLRLTPLEELWSFPLGIDRQTPSLEPIAAGLSPREALEAAVLPALRRPPCTVSFSGGVDSSVVLAVATHVARREGLPNPLPVTNRFPGVVETDETQWQERVIRHLELDDWLRLDWDDELDVLGPIATKVLRRHGILFPWNSFFHYPLLERAEGGALLTGVGGDELFKQVPRRLAARLLYEHRLPRPRQVPRLAFELSPRPIRRAVDAWRDDYFDQLRWIRAPQRRALARAAGDWNSRDPLRNDRALDLWWRCRMLQCGLASLDALARDFDTLVAHPLADPGLLEALARTGGAVGIGPGSRRLGVKQLVGDLLPRETLERKYKTGFDGAFWKGPARDFASDWDGSGVDAEQVDVDALSAEWSKPSPLPLTFIQLQRAWLGNAAGR